MNIFEEKMPFLYLCIFFFAFTYFLSAVRTFTLMSAANNIVPVSKGESASKRPHEDTKQDEKHAKPIKKPKLAPIMSLLCATNSDELYNEVDEPEDVTLNWATKIQGLSTEFPARNYDSFLAYAYTVEVVVPRTKISFVHALVRSIAKQNGTSVQLYSAYAIMCRANNCFHREWIRSKDVQQLNNMAEGESMKTILSWLYDPKQQQEESAITKKLLWPDLNRWKSMVQEESKRKQQVKKEDDDEEDSELESCYGEDQLNMVASCILDIPVFGQCLIYPLHCNRLEANTEIERLEHALNSQKQQEEAEAKNIDFKQQATAKFQSDVESKSMCPESKYNLGTNDSVMLELQDEKLWLEFHQQLCATNDTKLLVDEKTIVKKCLAICADGKVVNEAVATGEKDLSAFLQKYIRNQFFALLSPEELSSESLITIYKLLQHHHYPQWPASATTASIRKALSEHFWLYVDDEMLVGNLDWNRHFLDRHIFGSLCIAPKKFYK